MVTHSDEIISNANKVFYVKQKSENGWQVSYIDKTIENQQGK
jgi:hypothetical protein